MAIIKKLSIYYILAALGAVIVLRIINVVGSYEPPFVLSVLNTIFLGLLPLIVAFFSANIYLETDIRAGLFLCCSMLIFGVGSTVAGWLRFLPNGDNYTVTIHNVSVFIASLLHLAAAFDGDIQKQNDRTDGMKRRVLAVSVLASCATVTLLALAVVNNALPPFVTQNGFSMLRQSVLGLSTSFYLCACLLLVKRYQSTKSDYVFWYLIAMASMTVGLLAISLQPSVACIIGWIGRINQYIAGVYLLVLVCTTLRAAERSATSISGTIAEFFLYSEQMYKTLLESMHRAVISVNQNFRIFYHNGAAETLFGYREQTLINASFERLISEKDFYLLKKDLALLNVGGTSEFIGKTIEIQAMKSTGETFPAFVSLSVNRLSGGYICTYIIQDATETKQTQQARQNLTHELALEVEALKVIHRLNSNFIVHKDLPLLYRGILEAAATLTDTDKGSIQLIDEKSGKLEMIADYGLGPEFMQRLMYLDFYSGTCGKAYRETKRVIEDDVSCSTIFKDPSLVDFLLGQGIIAEQSTPLLSSSGKLEGVLNTYYSRSKQFSERELRILDMIARLAADTIERMRADQAIQEEKVAMELVKELNRLDQNKNVFLEALSHELRNPLAVISAGIYLLEVTEDQNKISKAVGIMKRQMGQITRLVDDLMDMSRIAHNRIELKKEQLDLSQLAKSVADDYIPILEGKYVAFAIDIAQEPIYVFADCVRLKQIIGNLIHNAYKFTNERGRVGLRVAADGDQALIVLEDDGIGIQLESISGLFKPFVQCNISSDRLRAGLGIGLSIVKSLAELHGGTVSACSEGVGKGARFEVRLPIIQSEQITLDDFPETKGMKTRCALIIDSHKNFAEILQIVLHLIGHEAVVACGGADGLDKAKAVLPDIIFCSVELPDMDGYAVARQIRQTEALKNVPLIALTGYAASSETCAAKETAFNMHLSKPVDISAIRNVLSVYFPNIP